MEKDESAAMKTLPSATPVAKTKLFSIFPPKSTRFQASVRFSHRWLPGVSGMGTRLTVRRSCVAAITTTAKGASAVARPRNSRIWLTRLKIGVRSTMGFLAIVYAALDETELHDGQEDDQQHQDDALRGGAGIVQAFEAVEIDLVDHQLRRLVRPAAGHDIDDAEAVGEAVREPDHEQEKQGGRQERQLDVADPAQEAGPVHRPRLDQRARNRFQRGEEEDEVVADGFPGEGDDDRDHGIEAVQRRVPEAGRELVEEGQEPRFRRQ